MASVNISEAAKLVGKSKRTIQRHISSGKLSKSYDVTGIAYIDTSELIRVYGKLIVDNIGDKNPLLSPDYMTNNIENELLLLKDKVNQLEKLLIEKDERLKDKQEHIDTLKHSLLLLEDKTEKVPQQNKSKKPLWKRIKDAISDE